MEARIESMGYEVGYRLVERTCQRRWMGGDQLEAIKFVCKDLWSEVRVGRWVGGCVGLPSFSCFIRFFLVFLFLRSLFGVSVFDIVAFIFVYFLFSFC